MEETIKPRYSEELYQKVRKEVEKRFSLYYHTCNLENLTEDEEQHVIIIGTSILCTKWNIGPEGGSFVRAIVDNDLMGAYGRADSTNIRAIHFYTMLVYNAQYPIVTP